MLTQRHHIKIGQRRMNRTFEFDKNMKGNFDFRIDFDDEDDPLFDTTEIDSFILGQRQKVRCLRKK